jgi:GTP-binding protein Era
MPLQTDSLQIPDQQKCGFIAVLGAPNAGKSTLVNALVGAKVSIVSHKVQTTRSQIRGIFCQDDTQIILIDTPGLFKPKRQLDRAMVASAKAGGMEADAVILVVDAASNRALEVGTNMIESYLSAHDPRPHILVLNKVDAMNPEDLLALSAGLNEIRAFDHCFMISALKKRGLDNLKSLLVSLAQDGVWHYPDDQLSDMPFKLSLAEITREQIYANLHQELPYQIAIETEHLEQFKDGSIKLSQVIYVVSESHRRIVLGKGGQTIKRIGEKARHEMGYQFDTTFHLALFVKVKENWLSDPQQYGLWGLDPNA